jgi:hypothetical protein
VTHSAFVLSTLALDLAHERQRRGERLARLLPHRERPAHGPLRRRLARAFARIARWLDAELPSAPPASRWA